VTGKNLKQHVGKMLADAPLPRKDSQRVANADGLQMMATQNSKENLNHPMIIS